MGLRVEELRHEEGGGDAVHGGVVDLGQHRDPAVVEPVDEPHLPQGPAPVQLYGGEFADDLPQFLPAAWGGEADVTNVGVDVKRRVCDPQRAVEAQRDRHDAFPQRRGLSDAGREPGLQRVEAEPAGDR